MQRHLQNATLFKTVLSHKVKKRWFPVWSGVKNFNWRIRRNRFDFRQLSALSRSCLSTSAHPRQPAFPPGCRGLLAKQPIKCPETIAFYLPDFNICRNSLHSSPKNFICCEKSIHYLIVGCCFPVRSLWRKTRKHLVVAIL